MNPQDLLFGIAVPGVIVGAFLLIAWGLGSAAARRDSSAPATAVAMAVSLGVLAGFGLLFGWNPKPNESWLWLLWVFPACAVLGGLEVRATTTAPWSFVLRIVLVALSIGLVLHKPILPSGGSLDFNRLGLYVGIPLIVISVWRAIFPFLTANVGSIAMWMVSTAAAAMLLFAGSLKFAQIGGALSGCLGALIVACLLRPSVTGLAGALTPVVVILSALVFLSFEYASVSYSRWLFVLVALAPAMGLIPMARKPWIKLALIAIPIAVAVGLAFRTYDTSAL